MALRLPGIRGFTVRLGDGVAGLAELAPASAGLILSDLPSGETAAKFDKRINVDAFFAAAWHALSPGGNVVLMAHSFRFAASLVAAARKEFRYDLVWSKSLPTGFLNAKSRPLRAHEFVLVFFRGEATYRAQMSEGHPPISSNAREATRRRRRGKNSENYDTRERTTGRDAGVARVGSTDRYPTSVLPFGSLGVRHPDRVHPQQKPLELLRYLVRTYSVPGQLVADVTAGSGSTGDAAIAEGRRFIGWDIDPRFGQAERAAEASA